ARYAVEVVVRPRDGVGRANDCPRIPIPVLDEGLRGAGGIVSHAPTVRLRCACDSIEDVGVRGVGAGRRDDCPRSAVPVLDQGLVLVYVLVVDAGGGIIARDRPAIGRRDAGRVG